MTGSASPAAASSRYISYQSRDGGAMSRPRSKRPPARGEVQLGARLSHLRPAAVGHQRRREALRPGDPPLLPRYSCTRRQTVSCEVGDRRPIRRANAALLGLRSTCSPRQITTGVSAGGTPSPRSRASASPSSSRSIHLWGSQLRATNARRRRVSGEKREPTILSPAPSPIRIERQIR